MRRRIQLFAMKLPDPSRDDRYSVEHSIISDSRSWVREYTIQ
jgi:hypothetical protein